ncbi:MAG: molecular chaperone TorD family protein [Acidimicrobiia bacterium]|nr:molecular chaperone TorD family protein [Acidimicrobiia bacterium]
MSAVAPAEPLVVRGVAFGLFARLLGPEGEPIAEGPELHELREVLTGLGDDEAVAHLDRLESLGPFDAEAVAGRHSRLFDQGRVSPYELSHIRLGPGGHTARLADVSGFYRAFGFRVQAERPDHVVAELEFAAFLSLSEAQARRDGNADGAEVCATAMRSFLRDHLCGWLDTLAEKLHGLDPFGPHSPVAAAASCFIDAEASRLGVEPEIRGPVGPFGFTGAEDDVVDDGGIACGGGCPDGLDADQTI